MIEVIKTTDFESEVLKLHGEKLIEFFDPNCPTCQKMDAVLEELDEELPLVHIYKIDVNESAEVAKQYAPDGTPTFVAILNGEIFGTATGEQTREDLLKLLGVVAS